MTGAPMPDGADAVVMVEDSERSTGDGCACARRVQPGVRARRRRRRAPRRPRVHGPAPSSRRRSLGVLASVNARTVTRPSAGHVSPCCRPVTSWSTDGAPLAPGQIRESNRTMLAPLLAEAGCDVVARHRRRRRGRRSKRVLRDGRRVGDAIVTSGGVSMGDYDVVKAVLGRIAEMRWMQIAIKPAKPFAFGTLDGVAGFGLPGNPVSSLVSFELLARPALRRMMGHRRLARTSGSAITDDGLRRRPDGKVHLVRVDRRVRRRRPLHVAPVGAQGSHQLAATALADALVDRPRRRRHLPRRRGRRAHASLSRPAVSARCRRSRRPVRPRHADLRISVTDRCNFRCTYCMPEEGMHVAARARRCSRSRRSSASAA